MHTDAHFTQPVVQALSHATGKERRAALRKLADQRVDAWPSHQRDAFVRQFTDTRSTAARVSWPAVRDALTMVQLLDLVMGFHSVDGMIRQMDSGTTEPWGYDYKGESLAAEMLEWTLKAVPQMIASGERPDIMTHAITNQFASAFGGAFTAIVADDAFDHNTQSMETPMASTASASAATKTLPNPSADQRRVLDTILASFGGGASFADIEQIIASKDHEITQLSNRPGGVQITLGAAALAPIPSTGSLPAGQASMQKANAIFGITGAAGKVFDFDIVTFDWGGQVHPMVPDVDPDYFFEPDSLLSVLTALLFNTKSWVYGHTGTGKTTLVEQVAARLNWPVIRLNFDSEISRLDMIGRDVIAVDKNGNTVTEFVDGVLPQAMQMPVILLCDEMDFIRPDVAYVMQRALENKGLLVTEDGGRLIQPHEHFRIFATANTKGAGDDTGRYMGARPQSGAFLNRFTNWIGVDYMKPDQVSELVIRKTGVDAATAKVIGNYAKDHWRGFEQNDLMQDLSARNLVACAEQYHFFKGLMPADKALEKAFERTVFNRAATAHDAQTMRGIFQRVVK